jgi:hypothetical protein
MEAQQARSDPGARLGRRIHEGARTTLDRGSTDMLQTFFGLTVPVTGFPLAAEARRDAEGYLAARRAGLRMAPMLERTCDEGAWAVMRATVSTPPLLVRAERMVA